MTLLDLARSLFWLARPAGTLLLLGVPAMGYGMALWGYAMLPWRPLAMLGVLAAWASLSAGTLWLNAALDGKEDGAVFSKENRLPPGLRGAGLGALGGALALAALSDRGAGLACSICAVLAVLYSHPRTAWKGHPILGPLVNVLGYGLLSPLAGWSVAEVPLDFRSLVAFVALALFVLGSTFAAQAFQREDDARRGYRTLVVTHGPATCLRSAQLLARLSLALVAALMVTGHYPRLCLLGLPVFLGAERWLQAWRRKLDGGAPRDAAGWLVRMLVLASVLIGLAYMDCLYDMWTQGEPTAGAATRRGRNESVIRP